MRIGFPVIFMRNGVEYAGIVASSSPRRDQVPLEDLNSPLTREQRFNELRCAIAFWDTEVRGWRQADNVPYLAIDVPLPAEGDFYSEVGAPDPGERLELKDAQAKHAAQMEEGRRAFEALPEEEKARLRAENQARIDVQSVNQRGGITAGFVNDTRESGLAAPDVRSPDPVDEDEAALTSAEHAVEAAIDDELDRDEIVLEGEGGNPLETRPIG